MSTKQIRINAMAKVRGEVKEYFKEVVKQYNAEGQYGTAETQKGIGKTVLSVIDDVMTIERNK